MTQGDTQARLAAFQQRFSNMLRTPLDRGTGTLRARPASYDPTLCAGVVAHAGLESGERLAVYNRQYWFRLFGVLQGEFRLATALLGAWAFNGHAAAFLQRHPPHHRDLARSADGFDRFLDDAWTAPRPGEPPRAALREALAIDQAFRTVLAAPAQAALDLGAVDAARLGSARLRPSAAVVLIDEHRPLLALRQQLRAAGGEPAVPLPTRYPAGAQTWLIGRQGFTVRLVGLVPMQARLLRLLRTHPVAHALAIVEQECRREDAAELPANARRWLMESVAVGMWSGLAEDAP